MDDFTLICNDGCVRVSAALLMQWSEYFNHSLECYPEDRTCDIDEQADVLKELIDSMIDSEGFVYRTSGQDMLFRLYPIYAEYGFKYHMNEVEDYFDQLFHDPEAASGSSHPSVIEQAFELIYIHNRYRYQQIAGRKRHFCKTGYCTLRRIDREHRVQEYIDEIPNILHIEGCHVEN